MQKQLFNVTTRALDTGLLKQCSCWMMVLQFIISSFSTLGGLRAQHTMLFLNKITKKRHVSVMIPLGKMLLAGSHPMQAVGGSERDACEN